MKKKIFSVLISMLLIASLFAAMPLTVSAGLIHDLTVTKAGAPATADTDFEWHDATCLYIKTNGCTVSGSTELESIEVAEGVTDLTIENISIMLDSGIPISFDELSVACTLTVKGTNLIDAGQEGLFCVPDLRITGDGDLTAITQADNAAIFACGQLTLDCAGALKVDGKSVPAFHAGSGIDVTANTGKILAYGNTENGAFDWNSSSTMTVAPGLTMTGAAVYMRAEGAIENEMTIGAGKLTDPDGNAAKSILIGKRISDVLATTDFPANDTDGWVNETGKKVFSTGWLVFLNPEVSSIMLDTTPVVTKSGDDYVYEMADFHTITFNMNNGVLESITYEHLESGVTTFNGTYAKLPPTGDSHNTALWLTLMGVACFGLLSCFVAAKMR